MRLTRVYRFSASHRLHAAKLPNEANSELYGKCNNPYGHGHNYVLHVSVAGDVNTGTGRVIDPAALDRFVQQRVIEAFDHKDMNADVPEFAALVPTTENLAAAIAKRLEEGWSFNARLARVFIEETPRNTFELRVS